MAHKRLTRSTSTAISIIAFVAILAAANVFLYGHYVRKDLTRSQMFTISEGTKSLLDKMNDVVNVTLYRSDNLPPGLLPDFRFTKEFLEEMAVLAGGNLNFRIEVPKNDEETRRALARKGIQLQQVNAMQKDEITLAAVYFHVLVQHLDKSSVITFPQPTTLEYDLASSLLEVTQREKPVVAFVTNDPDFKFPEALNYLRNQLGLDDHYDIRNIVLTEEDNDLRIPKNCKTLILVKPRNFSESDLYDIDQFVMNGGNLVAFVEAVDFDNPQAMFQPSPPPNILPLLRQYGIIVNTDLVMDYESHATRPVPIGRQGIFTQVANIPYPQWVLAISRNFDRENPALTFLQGLLMPYPNSLEFRTDLADGVKTETLISTTKKATVQKGPPFDLQPPQSMDDLKEPEETHQYMLAGVVTGSLVSYYKDREKPAEDKKEEDPNDPLAAMRAQEEEPDKPKLEQAENSRVLVISSAQILNPDLWRSVGGIVGQSLVFLENTIDWLTLGTDLIAIRTKPVQQYPLNPDLTDGQKAWARFLGRFAVPLLIVLIGIAWWFIRRHRLNKLAQVYAS